jgi:hypothetical protein
MLPNQMSRYSMDAVGSPNGNQGSVFAPMQGPMPTGRPQSDMRRVGGFQVPGPALSGGQPSLNMGGGAGPVNAGPQQTQPLQASGPSLPGRPMGGGGAVPSPIGGGGGRSFMINTLRQ